ncbi:DUF418 domain-containing protein [Devriesea agamarum]|uniref:hypothetical protein n=1 Tax=Devriesea agamarum TaxID=472569 RepID=UPI00071C3F89|nr:hypothetical protein [Devriesea agamarum]
MAPPHRLVAVDLARTLALIFMFVAHTAPNDGPGRILMLSEFLTAPLFAFLVGVSLMLSAAQAQSCNTHARTWALGQMVRASILVVSGIILALATPSVVIILIHLGVLIVVCLPLVALRTRTVAMVGVLCGLAGVLITAWVEVRPSAGGHFDSSGNVSTSGLFGPGGLFSPDSYAKLLSLIPAPAPAIQDFFQVISAGGTYRISLFVLYACAGIIVIRRLTGCGPARLMHPSSRQDLPMKSASPMLTDRMLLSSLPTAVPLPSLPNLPSRTGVFSMALAAVIATAISALFIVVPNLLGDPVHAYSGTLKETVGNLAGVIGIILWCTALTRLPWTRGRTLGQAVPQLLIAPGRMTFSLYVMQVVALYVITRGLSMSDDSWAVLAALILGSYAIVAIWRWFGPAAPWSRGPLEGVTALAERAVRRLSLV